MRLGGAERRVERRLQTAPYMTAVVVPAAANARNASGARRSAAASSNAALEREDVALEPVEQVEPGAQAGVRELRQVDMEVDQPGQQDQRPEVDRRVLGVRRLAATARRRRDPPGRVHLDPAVGLVARPAGGERRQDARTEDERRPVGKHVCHQTGCYMRNGGANRRTIGGWTPTSTAS